VTQAFYFWVWANASQGAWGLTQVQSMAMWVPFFLVGAYECRFVFWGKRPFPPTEREEGISVIIPTLNAAPTLPDCLTALQQSTVSPDEVWVVDGGSTDQTQTIASQAPVKLINSVAGRGNQIRSGVKQAGYRYVVILHADCELAPDSLATMRACLNHDPALVGGCFGQRFDTDDWVLVGVEVLNEWRATLGGAAFGDQAQFFDSRRFPCSGFPGQPLMEDVEFSLRLRKRGEFVYLGHECRSKADRWRTRRFKRIFDVFSWVFRYRLVRLFGTHRAQKYSVKLYEEYYGPSQKTLEKPR